MRLTKHRREILSVFNNTKEILSAEMIYQQMDQEEIDLSTIYRALDYFMREGIVAKSTIEQTAYFYLNEGEHHHYLICTKCHQRFPIDCHLERLMKKTIKQANFKVTHHDVTIYGFCEDCQ